MQNKTDLYYEKILEAFGPEEYKKDREKKTAESLSENSSFEIAQKKNEYIKNLVTGLETYINLTKPLIRTADLNKEGIRSREISALVDAGKIERVKQGYYKIVEYSQDDSEAKLIAELYPDGILCMSTALFYYEYSDRTPLAWDIAIDRNVSKARFNIDYPYVQPYFVDKKHLSYGITKANYGDCSLKIFDRDRLICECIKHENKMDREIFHKAIQGYIRDNKKNINHLINYAKRRNIHKKVKERIGVWL